MLRGPSAKVVAALMALALLGSACSSRDDDDASTESGGEDAAAGESSIDTADCVSDPTRRSWATPSSSCRATRSRA